MPLDLFTQGLMLLILEITQSLPYLPRGKLLGPEISGIFGAGVLLPLHNGVANVVGFINFD